MSISTLQPPGPGAAPVAPEGKAVANPHEYPPEVRPTILGDLREIMVDELWRYRELGYQLTLRDVRIRYKQAVMGFAWAILMPGLIVMAGALVRLAMAHVGGGEVEKAEIAGMAVKALPWAFFVGAIGFATSSLIGNTQLVTKIYFPREVLPISAIVAQGFDSLIGLATLIVVLPMFGVSYLNPALLWVPLLALLLFCFTTAAGLFLSCANLFFRDVKYLVQVFITFGIFFTPVFFEPVMFGPLGARLMMLNPLAPMLEGFRLAIIEGHNLAQPLIMTGASDAAIVAWSPWYLLYAAFWAFGGLAVSALIFHRAEHVFAKYA